MNLYGLIPILFGLILAIKPDIKIFPLMKRGSVGVRYHRTYLPLVLYRIGGIIAIVLGILVLFEIISVKGL